MSLIFAHIVIGVYVCCPAASLSSDMMGNRMRRGAAPMDYGNSGFAD
jgi:hypothetical protein